MSDAPASPAAETRPADTSGENGSAVDGPEILREPVDRSHQRRAVEEVAEAKSEEARKELAPETIMDATEWFLADDPDETPARRPLLLDMTIDPEKPVQVEWVVQAIDRERIQAIREASKKVGVGRRRAKQTGEDDTDSGAANLRIAAEGTLVPDLRDPRIRGEYLDPADALKYRLRNKQGLIDQIAVKVLEVSGYDEEDIQEITAVKN